MHLFIQLNGRFTAKVDRLARILQERHGFTKFSGLSTSEGHARWLQKEKNTPIRYAHIQALPELWRKAIARGKPDAARLTAIESDHGNLWRFIIADRNLGHCFLTGTILPKTALRRTVGDLDITLSCLQELFDYFEARFSEDRPDAVFFQVVASAPALVAASVCAKFQIPFFTLGKTKFDDRHHLATNALMQPDPVIERYADPNLVISDAARERYEKTVASGIKQTDHFEADLRNHAKRHGTPWLPLLWERLMALPAALKPYDKPYPPDPRAATAFQMWEWETKVKINFKRLLSAGIFETKMPVGDYVYLPLNVTPEASTCVVAPQYADQLVVVGALARSLPAGWRLVVKDHLPMCGRRTQQFYEYICQFQNTTLMVPTAHSPTLAKNSRVTAVIAGTSGWEAMLQGRPVLNFGSAWYLATGMAHLNTNLNHIDSDLREAVRISESFSPEERARRCTRMIQALMEGSFPFPYDVMWSRLSPDKLETSLPLFEVLANRIATRLDRMRHYGWQDPFDCSPWISDRTPLSPS